MDKTIDLLKARSVNLLDLMVAHKMLPIVEAENTRLKQLLLEATAEPPTKHEPEEPIKPTSDPPAKHNYGFHFDPETLEKLHKLSPTSLEKLQSDIDTAIEKRYNEEHHMCAKKREMGQIQQAINKLTEIVGTMTISVDLFSVIQQLTTKLDDYKDVNNRFGPHP
jgi:hypothetical protein